MAVLLFSYLPPGLVIHMTVINKQKGKKTQWSCRLHCAESVKVFGPSYSPKRSYTFQNKIQCRLLQYFAYGFCRSAENTIQNRVWVLWSAVRTPLRTNAKVCLLATLGNVYNLILLLNNRFFSVYFLYTAEKLNRQVFWACFFRRSGRNPECQQR